MASWQSKVLAGVLRILTRRPFDPAADPAVVREKLNRLALRIGGRRFDGRSAPVTIGAMQAEWVETATSDPARTLLYLHGGGYIVCSPDTHRPMVARLARASGARALLIDYRLAPEHPFPAAVEDAREAYRWLLAQGTRPSQIVVAGDSAGGGLTLALLLALKARGEPMPAAAVTLSPWTDLAFTSWAHLTHEKRDPMLSVHGAMLAARHYLQDTVPTEPLASPLYGDYAGLPPLLIHAGTHEILVDDSRRVAEKAAQAGVHVELEVWDRMPHVFQAFPFLPEARRAVTEIGDFVRRHLEQGHGAEPASLADPAPVPTSTAETASMAAPTPPTEPVRTG